MKNFIGLVNSLKRGVISPVYLLFGEETYLRDQAVGRFQEFHNKGGGSDLNFEMVDGEMASPAEITARAETLPFFAQKRFLVVHKPAYFKSNKRAAVDGSIDEGEEKTPGREEPLLAYINNPLLSTCLIFTTGEPVDKRKRLFQAVKKNGQVLEFNHLTRGELARWLAQKAGAAGKRFNAGAGDMLLDAAGLSLQKLVVELEKLFNYTAGREGITPEDVRQICPPRMEDNIFTIVDAVGSRRCGKALSGIKEMLAVKEPPLKILSMISRQFRLLLQVHDLLGRGFPSGEIQSRLNLHPYVARKLVDQSKNFDRAILTEVFETLVELDIAVKTGRQEFYPAVEMFLLKLCTGGENEKPAIKRA